MNVFLDIETIPWQAADARARLAAEVKPPATMSKPETLARWREEDLPGLVEEAYRKTAFNGARGQVVAVAWAFGDDPAEHYDVADLSPEAERKMLVAFFREVRTITCPTFIGHNIQFDLGFLWKRAVILGVEPPRSLPRNPKPWDKSIVDTMHLWAGDRGYVTLDQLAADLGIPGKGDVDGSMVWDLVQAGKLAEVAAYCRDDVELTRRCFNRLTFRTTA
jgi:predicted PolB exonuclease-like 3'-5' exonuclease